MGKKIPQVITQEEFEKIFEVEKDKQYKLAFLLGFEAGMRISEIVGLQNRDKSWKIEPLQKSQVDLSANTIKVISGKGKKDRIVPLPKRFNKNALELLPIKKGRRIIEMRIKRLGKEILGKDIHFHTLRHGFGSHLASTRPLHEVQMLMGHSRLDTTGLYLHANPKQAIDGARDAF